MTADQAAEMVPPAIFLHSNWRSSGTYVWAKFRSLPGMYCYFEPLNERLATVTQEAVDTVRPSSFANHPDLDAPCFAEYRPLLGPDGGIAGFPSDLIFRHYRLAADDPAPRLQAYVDGLTQFAHRQGRVPVFGLVRSSLRVGWFRRHHPGVHIYILRDPRRQFASYLAQALRGDSYFLERPWVIFGNNRDDPAFALLRALINVDDAPADADNAYWATRGWQASPADVYLIFYFLHRLAMRDVAGNCDLVIDVDRLAGDAAAIAETERRVAA